MTWCDGWIHTCGWEGGREGIKEGREAAREMCARMEGGRGCEEAEEGRGREGTVMGGFVQPH